VTFQLNLDTETVAQCQPAVVICVEPTASAGEALRHMKDNNRGAVLICRDQVAVGIFTERDALRMMAAGTSFDTPIEQVMTANPVVLHAGDKVAKAITLMAQGGYRRLPIVDGQGHPMGIIKVEGILHYLADHFPATIYNLPPEPHHSFQMREGA
jgi:CBS domain-containing protein